MIVTILQPSYIPWRGYFHQIAKSDLFIFYDDVQYDKHGWRNRNRIKTPFGVRWLTIPVHSSGAITNNIPINQVEVDWNQDWCEKHWQTIRQSYLKAPFFNDSEKLVAGFFSGRPNLLADFTIETTITLTRKIGIETTKFLRSSEMVGITGKKTERLINILKSVEATHYISGPSAQNYIDETEFQNAGIELEYMKYDYPPYPQLYPPYDPQVSIIDLLFMTGNNALDYIIPPSKG